MKIRRKAVPGFIYLTRSIFIKCPKTNHRYPVKTGISFRQEISLVYVTYNGYIKDGVDIIFI